ncbi:thermonuclease family protein [Rhizobacter fulvus]
MISAILLCTVVGISDGDTIKVRCAGDEGQKNITVRLAEIDAPEKSQAFGQRSKRHLSELCFQARAEVRPTTRDRYGRTVARVFCAGTDASAAMVRSGMAWAYTRYLTDPQIRAMELLANRERVGLWSDETATPPWEWRADRHNRNAR